MRARKRSSSQVRLEIPRSQGPSRKNSEDDYLSSAHSVRTPSPWPNRWSEGSGAGHKGIMSGIVEASVRSEGHHHPSRLSVYFKVAIGLWMMANAYFLIILGVTYKFFPDDSVPVKLENWLKAAGSSADYDLDEIKLTTLLYDTWQEGDPVDPNSARLDFLRHQLASNGVAVRTVGEGLPWVGWGTKLKVLVEVLEELPPDAMVVISDARDVLINPLPHAIDFFLRTFQEVSRGNPDVVVASAESHCCVSALTHTSPGDYIAADGARGRRACASGTEGCPYRGEKAQRGWTDFMRGRARARGYPDTPFPYLNAGLLVGMVNNAPPQTYCKSKASALLRNYRYMAVSDEEDDQAVMTDILYRRPDWLMLDYDQLLFGNNIWALGRREGCLYDWAHDRFVRRGHPYSTPLYLHFSGKFWECYKYLAKNLIHVPELALVDPDRQVVKVVTYDNPAGWTREGAGRGRTQAARARARLFADKLEMSRYEHVHVTTPRGDGLGGSALHDGAAQEELADGEGMGAIFQAAARALEPLDSGELVLLAERNSVLVNPGKLIVNSFKAAFEGLEAAHRGAGGGGAGEGEEGAVPLLVLGATPRNLLDALPLARPPGAYLRPDGARGEKACALGQKACPVPAAEDEKERWRLKQEWAKVFCALRGTGDSGAKERMATCHFPDLSLLAGRAGDLRQLLALLAPAPDEDPFVLAADAMRLCHDWFVLDTKEVLLGNIEKLQGVGPDAGLCNFLWDGNQFLRTPGVLQQDAPLDDRPFFISSHVFTTEEEKECLGLLSQFIAFKPDASINTELSVDPAEEFFAKERKQFSVVAMSFSAYHHVHSGERVPAPWGTDAVFHTQNLAQAGFPPLAVGADQPWEGPATAVTAFMKALEVAPRDQLVVLCEGWDLANPVGFAPALLAGAYARLVDAHRGYDGRAGLERNDPVVVAALNECCCGALTHAMPGDFIGEDGYRVNRACQSGAEGCMHLGENFQKPWTTMMRELAASRGYADTPRPFPDPALMVGRAGDILDLLSFMGLSGKEEPVALMAEVLHRRPEAVIIDYDQDIFAEGVAHKPEDCPFAWDGNLGHFHLRREDSGEQDAPPPLFLRVVGEAEKTCRHQMARRLHYLPLEDTGR